MTVAQILVVEDSVTLNRVMTLTLEQAGYSVAPALGCGEAFDRLTPDTRLLLLDLNLPGLDGMTCLTGVLERGFNGKVVLVSGASEGRELADVVGADGFLPKPFSPEDLVATVDRYMDDNGRPT